MFSDIHVKFAKIYWKTSRLLRKVRPIKCQPIFENDERKFLSGSYSSGGQVSFDPNVPHKEAKPKKKNKVQVHMRFSIFI